MATNNIQELRKRSIIDSLSAPVDITGGFKNIGGREFPRNLESPPLFQQPPIAEQIQTSPPSPVQAPGQPSPNWIEKFENYQPETQASDRLNRLLDEVPQRESPSIARRIVASGQAIKGGAEAAEKTMYAPHARNMADWTAKTGPFQQGATIERQSNANERQTLGQTATAAIAQQKADQANKIAEERNRIADVRAQAYDFQRRNPNMEIKAPPGGYLMGVNPQTLEQRYVLDSQGQKIPSGTMTQEALENLRAESRIEAARQTGADAGERTNQGGWDTYQYPDGTVVRWNQRTGEKEIHPPPKAGEPGAGGAMTRIPTTPRPSSSSETTPAEVGTLRNNKFQEVYDQYPNLRKYMIQPKTSNGDWQLAEPPQMGRWTVRNDVEDQEIKDYNELLGLIDPNAPKIPTRQTTPETSGKAIAPTTVPAAGRGTQSTSTNRPTYGPPLPDKFKPMYQQNDATGEIRVSNDGGKTWQPYTGAK